MAQVRGDAKINEQNLFACLIDQNVLRFDIYLAKSYTLDEKP